MVNAVITSLPSYNMQIQWFPQYVCHTLDKTVRNFIWKGLNNTGMHMVSVKKMAQPRKMGGLGIRTAYFQNVALLGKLV